MDSQKGGFLKSHSRTNSTRKSKPPPPKMNGQTPRAKAKGNLSQPKQKIVKPPQSERQKTHKQKKQSLNSPQHVISLNTPSPTRFGININTGKQRKLTSQERNYIQKMEELKIKYNSDAYKDERAAEIAAIESGKLRILEEEVNNETLQHLQNSILSRKKKNVTRPINGVTINGPPLISSTKLSLKERRHLELEEKLQKAREEAKQNAIRQIETERERKLIQNKVEKEIKQREFNKEFYNRMRKQLEYKAPGLSTTIDTLYSNALSSYAH